MQLYALRASRRTRAGTRGHARAPLLGPEARSLARHMQSSGLPVSGLSPPAASRPPPLLAQQARPPSRPCACAAPSTRQGQREADAVSLVAHLDAAAHLGQVAARHEEALAALRLRAGVAGAQLEQRGEAVGRDGGALVAHFDPSFRLGGRERQCDGAAGHTVALRVGEQMGERVFELERVGQGLAGRLAALGLHVLDAGIGRIGGHFAQEGGEVEPLALGAGLGHGFADRGLAVQKLQRGLHALEIPPARIALAAVQGEQGLQRAHDLVAHGLPLLALGRFQPVQRLQDFTQRRGLHHAWAAHDQPPQVGHYAPIIVLLGRHHGTRTDQARQRSDDTYSRKIRWALHALGNVHDPTAQCLGQQLGIERGHGGQGIGQGLPGVPCVGILQWRKHGISHHGHSRSLCAAHEADRAL